MDGEHNGSKPYKQMDDLHVVFSAGYDESTKITIHSHQSFWRRWALTRLTNINGGDDVSQPTECNCEFYFGWPDFWTIKSVDSGTKGHNLINHIAIIKCLAQKLERDITVIVIAMLQARGVISSIPILRFGASHSHNTQLN